MMTRVNAKIEKRERIIRQKVLRSLSNAHLKLTLLPTERCNFHCVYCYEDFELGTMPRWVVDGINALISARAPELKLLDLRWFGGEPLIAYHRVREICGHANELAASHGTFSHVSSMTTNGYLLTKNRFAELLNLGVRHYQISLDGWKDEHDRTRRRRGGGGTFGRIWRNLLSAREVDDEFSIMLRLHFTPSTIKQTKGLIAKINEEFGDDQRFKVFFKAIARLGGPNDSGIDPGPPGWQQRAKSEFTAVMNHQEAMTDPVGDNYICYASEPNSFVIRSNGQLAKCTVAFDDPRNQIGFIRPDGTLRVEQDRLQLWFGGLETLRPEVLACPLPYLAHMDIAPLTAKIGISDS